MTAPMVRILGLLGAALLLASCSGPFFSKVEVKTSPTVYAALGNAKANISDYMSVSKVRDMLKGSADVKVYDYQDSSTVQKFLIHYPLTSIQLDFGQYLKDINLEGQLGQTLTPMSFAIPAVAQTSNSSASFDVNSTLQSTVNSGFGTSTSPFVETGLGSNTATLPDVAISVSSFSSATFSAGSLKLDLSMAAGASANLVLTATIDLVDSSTGVTITGTSTPVDIKAGGTAVLPLTGKTLPGSFKVKFTATTSGGVSFKNDTVNVKPSLSSDVAISAASGVSFTTTVNVPSITVPMSLPANSTFVKAQIATGKLAIDLGALPAGWTGFSRSTAFTLTQTGGLNLTPAAITTQTVDLDLANKIIGSADMAISASTTVTASNASFSGLSGPTSIAFSSAFTVDKFNYVVVKPGSSFTPTQNFSQATSQQMKDWVNFVDFTSVGLQIDFTNDLPAGNDMTINASSTAFGIPAGTPKVLDSNKSTSVSFLNSSLHFTPGTVSTLDFAVTLQPQSYNSGTGELTLNNIIPNTTLHFSGTVSLVNEWSVANIKPPAGGYSGKFPDTGTTDLSALADYLGPGLSFGDISSYLYVSGLTGASGLSGLIQATYTEASVAKTFDVLGTTGTPAVISMLAAPPTLTTKADGETIDAVANPLLTGLSDVSATLGNLATPLNAKPKDFALTYKLNMTGLNINKADTVSGSVPKKLLAELIMILPVQLIASGGVAELKVGNALPTTDLFGRKAGGDNSNINNMLDKLVSMSMGLSINNKTGIGGNAVLTDGGTFSKSLNLAKGVSSPSLTLTSADIKKIRDTIPFVLKLNVTVPDGTYSMERAGSINANITVNAVTDIDQTFNLSGSN